MPCLVNLHYTHKKFINKANGMFIYLWIVWKRSFGLEAVQKCWQMILKSTQLISVCSAVNKELQGIDTGGMYD